MISRKGFLRKTKQENINNNEYHNNGYSNEADPPIWGEYKLDRLGKPFGKELQSFNLERLYELGNGTIKATFDTCVEGFTTPMGVEMLKNEFIVSNMNADNVEFRNFNGYKWEKTLKLPSGELPGPSHFIEPNIVTMTVASEYDGSDTLLLVADKLGLHVFDIDGNFIRTTVPQCEVSALKVKISSQKVPVRVDGGAIILVVEKDCKTYLFERWNRDASELLRSDRVQLPTDPNYAIRFSQGVGNTIILSDMNRFKQTIWHCDLIGRVRNHHGIFGEGDDEFVQASGLTIDNMGNYLVIDSMTSRLTAFRADGSFMCNVQFPEGPIERPTDVSINDDGKMAMVALTGKCFLFDLEPGDCFVPHYERGPRPRSGYTHWRGLPRGKRRGVALRKDKINKDRRNRRYRGYLQY